MAKKTIKAEAKTKAVETIKKTAQPAVEPTADSVEVLEAKLAKLKNVEAIKAKAEAAKLNATRLANRPSFKHSNGFNYAFKDSAPLTLNIDGKPQATKDLIKSKDVMLMLIEGNSNFVEQIK